MLHQHGKSLIAHSGGKWRGMKKVRGDGDRALLARRADTTARGPPEGIMLSIEPLGFRPINISSYAIQIEI